MLTTNIPPREDAPRKGDWMLTYTGRIYWPIDPRASEVNIEDIAHSLAYQCRYGGHCAAYYSVAEHSVLLSRLLPSALRLMGLLHDATETYVTDVPRPLKPSLSNYREIEASNRVVIAEAFGLPPALHPEVEDLDRRICLAEMGRVMPRSPLPLGIDGPQPNVRLELWDPCEAEMMFLAEFDKLWQEKIGRQYPASVRRK